MVKHLDAVIADAEQFSPSFKVKLTGTYENWYGAAVQVITAAAHGMGIKPEWNHDEICLRFYRHPHSYVVYAHNPEMTASRILAKTKTTSTNPDNLLPDISCSDT